MEEGIYEGSIERITPHTDPETPGVGLRKTGQLASNQRPHLVPKNFANRPK